MDRCLDGTEDPGHTASRFQSVRDAVGQIEHALAATLSFATLARIPPFFLILAAIHLLYVVTFPPNTIGDMHNYFEMIRRNQSNLIHAGGYPFFMRLVMWLPVLLLIWRGWYWVRARHASLALRTLATVAAVALVVVLVRKVNRALAQPDQHQGFIIAFQYYLIVLQHLIFLLTLSFAFRTIADFLSPLAAYVAVGAVALHPIYIVQTSWFFPEWLQASFLTATFCIAYWAFRATDDRTKLLLYSCASAVFTWSFLVKPSILVVGWVLLIVFCCDRTTLRWRLRTVGCMALVGLINYCAFIFGFHRPSTGTFAFTHDKAWVLLIKSQDIAPAERMDPRIGINTKRLMYLNAVLPRGPEHLLCAGPLWHVDQVPMSKRAPFREKYLSILHADDATLDRLLRDCDPTHLGEYQYAFCPAMSYLGVAEGDLLGTKVFLEHARAYPGRYAKRIAQLTYGSLWEGVEVASMPGQIPNLDAIPYERINLGFARLQLGKTVHEQMAQMPHCEFWSPAPYVWTPGLSLFAAWRTIGEILFHQKLVLGVIVAGCIIALGRCLWKRQIDVRAMCLAALASVVLTFIVCSNILHIYRWKEHLPMLFPISVLFVTAALELTGLALAAIRGPGQPRPAWVPQPDASCVNDQQATSRAA